MSTAPTKPGMFSTWQSWINVAITLLASIATATGGTAWMKSAPTTAPVVPVVPAVPGIPLADQLANKGTTDLRFLSIAPVPGGVRGLAWTPAGSEPSGAQEVTLMFGEPKRPAPAISPVERSTK